MRSVLSLLILLLVSGSAEAAGTWTDCLGGPGTPPTLVDRGSKLCWDFNQQDDSPQFTVQSSTALVCLNPNLAGVGPLQAQVMIRYCIGGLKPATNPQNVCIAILDAPLTGTEGATGTQASCQRVATGAYYIEVTNSSAGNNARIAIQGEAP